MIKKDLSSQSIKLVGGVRRVIKNNFKRTKPALSLLNELLNDREYQMSKELPDVTTVEFLYNTEDHKWVQDPIVRISQKLQLTLILGNTIDMTSQDKEKLEMPVFKQDDQTKENRHQRRFKPVLAKCLRDYTLNNLPHVDLCRIVIQGVAHVIRNAKV